jgi:hypothetical protein
MPEKVLEMEPSLEPITHSQRGETSMPTDRGHHATISGTATFEVKAGRILGLLPGAKLVKTQDAIQIEYGGEEGIVLIVTAEGLELRHPTIEWAQGSHGPVSSPLLWKRVIWDKLKEEDLPELLRSAQTARKRRFHKCRYCGERFPPERRISKDVCHGCASRYEGVVF